MPRAATCDDCYFRQRGLCALACERPCPTFRRPVDGKLVAPRQAQLIPTNDAFVDDRERQLVATP